MSVAKKHDLNTIFLHGLTALMVFFQFLSAEFRDFFPRPERHLLIIGHMSFGFSLAFILTLRIAWRLSFGTVISEPAPTLLDRGAKALHILRYLLRDAVLRRMLPGLPNRR